MSNVSAMIVPGNSVGFDVLVPSGSMVGNAGSSRNDWRLIVPFSRIFALSCEVTLKMVL